MANAEDDKDPSAASLALTEAEVEVLVKACKKYRATLPTYLKSGEAEARIIDVILRKLR